MARGLAPRPIDGAQVGEAERCRVAGGLDEVDGVLGDAAVDEHLVGRALQRDQPVEVDDLLRRPAG